MERVTYTVEAKRSGAWWAIRVLEVPGAFTQARHLDEAEAMGRAAVVDLLDVEPDSFDVALEVRSMVPVGEAARYTGLRHRDIYRLVDEELVGAARGGRGRVVVALGDLVG
jgi:hypothetical protein